MLALLLRKSRQQTNRYCSILAVRTPCSLPNEESLTMLRFNLSYTNVCQRQSAHH